MSRDLSLQATYPLTIPEGGSVDIPVEPFIRPLAEPGSLTVRMAKSGGSLSAVVILLQGGAPRVVQTFPLTTSQQDYVLTLTAQQIRSLIPSGACNVGDLVLRIRASTGGTTDCCPDNPIGDLYAQFTSTCAAINGKTVTLTYVGIVSGPTWSGTLDAGSCGPLLILLTHCGTFISAWDTGCFHFTSQTQQPFPCPFVSVRFDGTWNHPPGSNACNCCNITDAVTVIVNP